MSGKDTAYKVAILLFNCLNANIHHLCNWVDNQGTNIELIFLESIDSKDITGMNCKIQICKRLDENETVAEHIYRALKLSRAQYVTWIDAEDYFCNGALNEMCHNLDNDCKAKAVCGGFAYCDEYGEKGFSPLYHIGEKCVINHIRTCFLIERKFLLGTLRSCYVNRLWEQYIWNEIYRKKYKINIIFNTLLITHKTKYSIEIDENFKYVIQWYIKNQNISDLKYLLKTIDDKNPQGYLYNRLIGIISPETQRQLENYDKTIACKDGKLCQADNSGVSFPAYIKKRILVIYDYFGGFGDNLFHSHLPRIAKECGNYDKVYFSSQSKVWSNEIVNLVWKLNPFVDGITNEKADHFVLSGKDRESIIKGECNLLDCVMLFFKMDDKERFHEPEIYYTPKLLETFKRKTIFDPNYFSNAGDSITSEMLFEYFRKNNVHFDYRMSFMRKYVSVYNSGTEYTAKSLFDFCDVLSSAKNIYCFATGTATLCAALRKKAHVLYGENMNVIYLHSKLNNYVRL